MRFPIVILSLASLSVIFSCENSKSIELDQDDPLFELFDVKYNYSSTSGNLSCEDQCYPPSSLKYLGDGFFNVDGDTIKTKLIYESGDDNLSNCELRSSFKRYATNGDIEFPDNQHSDPQNYFIQINYYECKKPEILLLVRRETGHSEFFYESSLMPVDLSQVSISQVPEQVIENIIDVYKKSMLDNDPNLFATILNNQFGSGRADSIKRADFLDAWSNGDQKDFKWTKVEYRNHDYFGERLYVNYHQEGVNQSAQKRVSFNRRVAISLNKSYKISYIYDYIEDLKSEDL